MAFAAHQTGAGKDSEVRRHRVLRNRDKARQFTGGNPIRFTAYKQPERVEARGLRQRR